jgi:hypothetical protein
MLKTVTNKFNKWFLLPARGLSGGFLIGCNNSYFIIEQTLIGIFFITLMIKDRLDGNCWIFTTVYGPVNSSLKAQF